jgi:hypothetical protein
MGGGTFYMYDVQKNKIQISVSPSTPFLLFHPSSIYLKAVLWAEHNLKHFEEKICKSETINYVKKPR